MNVFKTHKASVFNNLTTSVAFGVLSLLFGQVRFNIPLIEGVGTSLGEIPVLVSVFYLSNPIYLILVAAIKGLSNLNYFTLSVAVHAIGLVCFWYGYNFYFKKSENNLRVTLLSCLGVLLYYVILTVPLLFIVMGSNNDGFLTNFISLFRGVSFEMVATLLVVTLYLLQYNSTQKIKKYALTLEDKVKERTQQLDKTIKKLNNANEELKSNNETLDLMVADRTKELENRNIQLTGYAFINSHLLRAPLARILGLSNLIKHELERTDDKTLIDKFLVSCQELDEIVNLLSEFLSEESVLSKEQLEELQGKIVQIASEIQSIERV